MAKLLGGYSSLCLRSQGTVPLVERLFDTSSKNIPLLLISTWFLVLFALSGVTCTANNQLRYAFIQSASSVSSDTLAIRNISIQLIPNVLAVEAFHGRARRNPFKPNNKLPPRVSPLSSNPSAGKLRNPNPRCLPGPAAIAKVPKDAGVASMSPRPADKIPSPARKAVSQSPRKRALTSQKLRAIVSDPGTNVRGKDSKVRKWTNGQTSGALGTGGLCGCTTVVI